MNRYRIETRISIDINAEDEDDARDAVYAGLDNIEGVREPIMHTCDVTEVPYALPVGAERWGRTAHALRFEDDSEPRRFGMLDGSWWWTNGHIALRCDGAAPTVGDEWKRIPDDSFAKILDTHERRSTLWGSANKDADDSLIGRRAFTSPGVAIQQKYHAMVDDSVPGAKWMIGGETQGIFAYDREGRLMAIVMPMRSTGLPALDLGSSPKGSPAQ